jgi:serine/threonine protein kinase
MPIDSERIQRAFLVASACADRQERAAMVARLAEGDAEFVARLEALLRAHDEPGDLPSLLLGPVTAALDCADECQAGQVMAGRYRLLSEVGEGGMGAVWSAEQIAPVRRRVALKLLKLGMDTRRVLARFEAERQALALMDHPFIAHVFDGGATESGRPFFVMEYVDGAPVTDFCDTAKLNLRDRLRLFLDVCQAVQHAHQKGVIHRDLKPSNVLVCRHEGRAVPKIIDFGLAKAIHGPLLEQAQQTGPATLMGTPRYMSPEQTEINNADVDTRADVYALGAILYELMTGTTPIDVAGFQDASWAEIVRQIKDVEPARPSHRLRASGSLPALAEARGAVPAQLCREVRGDLDWIALKALEKNRARRYQTVGEFARDIGRYLDHQAIEARPPSALYRFSKFARRNRVMLSAGVLVTVTLIGGTVISTAMAIRARQAVTLAEAARRDEILHRQSAERRRTEAELARAAEAEQRAIAQKERNDAEQHRARAEFSFRQVRNAQDSYFEDLRNNQALSAPDQLALRKELLSQAMDYYRQLVDLQSDDPALRAEYAHAYVHIGELNGDIGLTDQAIEAYRQAARRYEELIRDEPHVRVHCSDLAFTLARLAFMQKRAGCLAEAEASYRRNLEICETLAKTGENTRSQLLEVGRANSELADLQRILRRYADAVASLQRAFEIFDALEREAPLDGPDQRYRAGALYSWAWRNIKPPTAQTTGREWRVRDDSWATCSGLRANAIPPESHTCTRSVCTKRSHGKTRPMRCRTGIKAACSSIWVCSIRARARRSRRLKGSRRHWRAFSARWSWDINPLDSLPVAPTHWRCSAVGPKPPRHSRRSSTRANLTNKSLVNWRCCIGLPATRRNIGRNVVSWWRKLTPRAHPKKRARLSQPVWSMLTHSMTGRNS